MSKQKPAELRILEGNRGHRPIPATPEYPMAEIEPPGIVRNKQRKLWNQYAPILWRAGTLREPDIPGWMITTYLLAEMYDLIKDRKSIRAIAKEIRPWLQEYGMTPASRAKIDIGEPIKVPQGYLD